jgi:catechol 2,3-dioxygenase-like lactoylglutathione lyase family enzyme
MSGQPVTETPANASTEESTVTPTRRSFHLSLNVADLANSVRFFETFFDCPAAKQRPEYAKFELTDPPLVLSLEPGKPSADGVLNHVGLRMPSVDALVDMQRRLESRGLPTQRIDGVECCYARQTKFWVHDPDGVLWEVYTLDEDIDHHGFSAEQPASPASEDSADPKPTVKLPESTSPQPPAPAVWSHRLGQPLPAKLFVNDGSVDEIHLQGTFNGQSTAEQRGTLLRECVRALKPSGTVLLHQLTSDRAISPEQLQLPGAAAVVEQVLPIETILEELKAAGFNDVVFRKYGQRPCFVRDHIEMRETMLLARKGSPVIGGEAPADSPSRRVLFKGPAARLMIDDVQLVRGKITEVSAAEADRLQQTLGDQLVVFDAAADSARRS